MNVYKDIKMGLEQAVEYEKKICPTNCDIPMPQGFGKQEGWICPVCGRGVAPWVGVCPCNSDWKITYGTATSINNDGNSQSTVTDINSEWNQYSTYTESEK